MRRACCLFNMTLQVEETRRNELGLLALIKISVRDFRGLATEQIDHVPGGGTVVSSTAF
jgi:hypothetical protein